MNEFVEALKQKRIEHSLTLQEMVSLLHVNNHQTVSKYLTEKSNLYEYQCELFMDNLQTLVNTEQELQDVIKPQQ